MSSSTVRPPGRVRPVLVGATTLAIGASLLAVTPAQAASLRELTGGYQSGGTTFAKQDTSLTMSVTAANNAKCVYFEDVTTSPSRLLGSTWQNGGNVAAWSLTFTTGAGDGARQLRATPTKSFISGGGNAGSSTTVNRCVTTDPTSESAATASYTSDNTVPTITGSHAPAPGKLGAQNGWYRDDVVVSFSCGDGTGSGVASCTAPETLTGEGSNVSRTGTATDNVGNSNTATVSGINIDRAAPLTTADAPSGWQNNGVTVTLSASDNASGVASTQYSLNDGAWTAYTSGIMLGEGQHTLKYRSTDVAGNAEAEKTATVDIDTTAPTIDSSQDPAKNTAGWNNQDSVTITFTCGDTLSGIATAGGCTTPQSVTAEGLTNVSGTAVDNAGNTNTVVHPVSIDRTAPTISGAQSPVKPTSGWNTTDVTVNFTCDDDRSGVVSCPDSVPFGEGAGQSVTRSVSDRAGNTASATVSGINVDKSEPTTTDNAPTGWQSGDFQLTFSASDQTGLSGVDYTEYKVGSGDWTRGTSVTLGEGSHTVLYRSADNAGNVEQHETATVNVDKTAPAATVSAPATTSDESVTVTGTVSDTGSGVSSLTVNGAEVTPAADGTYSTSVAVACGTNTITAIVTDGVGRTHSPTATTERTCTVVLPPADEPAAAPVWTHRGFSEPIGSNTTTPVPPTSDGSLGAVPQVTDSTPWNTSKGGSTIPLKFNVWVDGAERTSATGTVKSFNASKITCPKATPIIDAVEEFTSGTTSLRYSGTSGVDGQFIQNWKTPTVSGNTCYRVALVTEDNSALYTFVQLRK